MIIINPYRLAEIIPHDNSYKEPTWAERKRTQLIRLRNKRVLLKKKIIISLITIFGIVPIMLFLSALPSFIFNIDDNVSLLWGLCMGMLGFIMYLKTEDYIYD